MPERRACVTRELTKVYEECVFGTLRELSESGQQWRGEITLLLGPQRDAEELETADDAQLDERITSLLAGGMSLKDVVRGLSQASGMTRRQLYQRALQLAGSGSKEPDSTR